MSSDRYLAERLPWYLNGTLDAAERDEVERLLAASEENRLELVNARQGADIYGHRLPAEVMVDYAFDGEHPAVPSALMERYLAVSPVGGEEIEMLRESRARLESETVAGDVAEGSELPAGVVPFVRPGEAPAAPSTGWQRVALAASLVGVAALGFVGWQWTELNSSSGQLAQVEAQLREALAREQRTASEPTAAGEDALRSQIEQLAGENELLAAGKSDLVDELEQKDSRIEQLGEQVADLSQPLINVPVLDLYPADMVLRGATQAERPLVVSRQTRAVTLILNSHTEEAQSITGLRILGDDGVLVWRSPTAPERDELVRSIFTVSLPVQELAAGVYTLELLDGSGAAPEVVESYRFDIR